MRQTPRRALATLALAFGFVVDQPSLRIGLGETLQGTLLIVGWHDYALEVPAGVSAILVSVDARGRDADLAVYGPGGTSSSATWTEMATRISWCRVGSR